jgi:hypothetical protein
MASLFARPMPIVAIEANQSATAPASNVAQDESGLVWRSSNLTTPYIILDMGAGVTSYDTIAVIGTNLRATDTVQIRTGTTATGIGAYAGTAQAAFTGNKPIGWTTKSVYRFTARTERYVRIDLVSTGNPSGYTEVQRIVIGKAIITLGVDTDPEQTLIDYSNITSDGGSDVIDVGSMKMMWRVNMGWVDDAQWRSDWLSFFTAVGKRNPFLFVPIVETPSTWQQDVVFGRMRNDPGSKMATRLRRSVEIKIEGISL